MALASQCLATFTNKNKKGGGVGRIVAKFCRRGEGWRGWGEGQRIEEGGRTEKKKTKKNRL